jgi:hypothetical protein
MARGRIAALARGKMSYKQNAVFGILLADLDGLSFLRKILGRKPFRSRDRTLAPIVCSRGPAPGNGAVRGCA